MAGREVYFVNHAVDPFNHWHPYSDTEMFPWLVGPLVSAAPLPSRDSKLPIYTDAIGSTVWCIHAQDAITDAEVVRMIRLADYNCGRTSGKRDKLKAVFRNTKDAELWRVMVRLSFDDACPPDELEARLGRNDVRSIIEVERYHVFTAIKRWMGLIP